MTLQVSPDATAIEFIAQLATEHVENPASLRIGVKAELVFGKIEVASNDGIGVVELDSDAARALIHHIKEFIVPVLSALVEAFVVGGEAFVKPEVRPVFAGHEVAEPLMRHLVSN